MRPPAPEAEEKPRVIGFTRSPWVTKKALDDDTERQYQVDIKGRHRSTLVAVFADPVRSGIVWTEIEALLRACGAEIEEGRGSRVRVALEGVRAVFHRPHPQKETDKGAVKSVRRFLNEAGIKP